MSTTVARSLPPLAVAAAYHLPALERELALHMTRATIVRSFSASEGTVSIRLVFSSDEDRFDNANRALRLAYADLQRLGFLVRYSTAQGAPPFIKIVGYYGPAIPDSFEPSTPAEPAPAIEPPAPGLAKVIDFSAARAARRAS